MRSARAGQVVVALAAACVLAFALLGDDEYTQHLMMWAALNAVLAVGLRFMLLVGGSSVRSRSSTAPSPFASAHLPALVSAMHWAEIRYGFHGPMPSA